MTKQQLQQELKEKVKEGVKPSQLKRSKSLDDIPKTNQPCPKCSELQRQLNKTNQDWTTLAQKRLDNLKTNPNPRLAELEKELEETVQDATTEINRQENEIKQLKIKLNQVNNQNTDLTEQLKTKQLEITNYERAAEFRLNNPFKDNSNFWEDYGPLILLLGLYALSFWLLNHKTQTNHK